MSLLSDAVLCLRAYEDPAVQAELDILLGHDRDAAWQFVHLWRVRASSACILYLQIQARLELSHRAYWPDDLPGRAELEQLLTTIASGAYNFG